MSLAGHGNSQCHLINSVHVDVESVSDPGGQMAENATVLIIAATHFLFNLDWLVEHKIRLENPFSHCIFASFVAFRRTRDRVGTDDMSILSDDNFYHHRKMLSPQRRWPLRKARHINWVQTHARDPVAEWTNRVLRRYKARVIYMRNEFNGFHAQLQERLATIRDIHLLREVTPLKRHDPVVDGLEPTPPTVVTKD